MNNLFNYVYIENLFSKEFCDDAITHINSLQWTPHTWYGTDSGFVSTKDFMTTYSDQLQQNMRSSIYHSILNYLKYVKTSFALHATSEIRFNIYQPGSEITEHIDHIQSLFDGERKGIPILSMVGIFNDDYEGGEFILCGEKIDLKSGDVVVFPSIFLYPHSVTPIIKGVRYSWVLWNF